MNEIWRWIPNWVIHGFYLHTNRSYQSSIKSKILFLLPEKIMRLYAISDLHVDFMDNWNLINQLGSYSNDGLIVAGDIADSLDLINQTFDILQTKFKIVFYTPGNHELWTRNYQYDSLHKLNSILELCDRRGIVTQPHKIENYWIVPLYSWYDCSLPIDKNKIVNEWADYHLCKWPLNGINLTEYFASLNQKNIRIYDGRVISFSHFLPTSALLPDIQYLRFKSLSKVSVSPALTRQIDYINSKIHVFGHSHINCDLVINGVRYIQNALRYPKERKINSLNLKLIIETDSKEMPDAVLKS